jgi:glycosyltransferase involved in cell wall biosynthesis
VTSLPQAAKPDVCVLAKATYPYRVGDQHQDTETYGLLAPWVRRFYLVVTSAGDKIHLSHQGNVLALHIPYGRNQLLRLIRFWIFGFLVARRLLRKRTVGLLMASEPIAGGPLAMLLRALYRIPVVVHLQADYFHLPTHVFGGAVLRAIRWIVTSMARKADYVRCISEQVRRDCLGLGLRSERLRTVPIRCDFSRFDRASLGSRRAERRSALGLAEGGGLVLSIGGLNIHKGYPTLIRAFSELLKSFPEWKLLIVGEGPLRVELEQLVRDLGIGRSVMLPGWENHREIPSVLAAADIYTQPSFDEGVPRATLEAMAMALPVVASRVGGIPDLVQEGVTGLLTPAGDAASLARALMSLARDEHRRGEFGRAGRSFAQDAYSLERGIRAYGELIEDARTSSHSRPLA